MLVRLAAFTTAACFAFSAAAEPSLQTPAPEAANAGDQAFLNAVRDLTAQMHRHLPTGDVDEDFVRISVTQRQAAIAMAKAELKYGKDERLKALAREIVTAQEKEIALMKAWEDKRRGGH